ANRYALDGENLSEELTELICSAVFSPVMDEECMFPEEFFNQERRQLLETIDSDFNDKKTYAKGKCVELMFANEPAGVKRYGTKEAVLKIERETLLSAWLNIVQRGRFELCVLGDCDFNTVYKTFHRYFDLERFPVELSNRIVLRADKVNEVTETMQLSQSKLVMGFRIGVIPEDSVATRVMCVLFGGSASSKLFVNVREKLSLCYYCSSRLNEIKGTLFVESGVECANIEKAKGAILEQLQDICAGKFTPEDLTYAKLSMNNSYKAVGDSLYATENWYLNQIFSEEILAPEEMAEKVSVVTRLDVIEAARKVTLDTVYILKGVEKDGQ
ncbi:MAG: insulinase family protein, partial [Oscillospiraceae bacterium]